MPSGDQTHDRCSYRRFNTESERMKRLLANHFMFSLVLGVIAMSGWATSTTNQELELTTYDPIQDHRKIATYYNHEAAKLRQTI